MIGRVLVIAAVLTSGAIAGTARAPLVPIQPWVLDYAAERCIATREYGSPSAPITLVIIPSPNLETYELSVVKSRKGPWYAEELDGSVDFGPGPIKAQLLHYGKRKEDVERFRISAFQMEEARGASSVKFVADGEGRESFALELMPDLIKGLKDCTEDLRRYWNFDGQKSGKIALPARGDVRSVFTGSDFPPQALMNRQEGQAQFLLLVDEQGKVGACHVLQTSGVPDFDAMGCAVIEERAKFTPALDRLGKPVRSAVVTPLVSWRIAG